jgi:hypothetical protein
MFVRVRDFGKAHQDLFPESTPGGQAFAAVATAVTHLSAHTVSKMSSSREGQRAKTKAREALLERLETIGRTARAIAEVTPGFDDPFRLPRRHSDEALLMAGRVFVQDAEACRSQFIGHRLPETFVTDLAQLVEAFEKAIHECEVGKSARAVAQAGISAAVLSGLAAVRQLDVIVPNELAGDPALFAGWERDRRVDYPNRAKRMALVPPPAPADPPPTALAPPATTPAATSSPKPVGPEKPVENDANLKVAS